MPMLLGVERQTERRAKRTAENSDLRSDPPVDLDLLDLGEIVWEIERKCQYWIFIYGGGKHLWVWVMRSRKILGPLSTTPGACEPGAESSTALTQKAIGRDPASRHFTYRGA